MPWLDPSVGVKNERAFYLYFTVRCNAFADPALKDLVRGRASKRVVLELRGDVAPYSCESFRRLCCGEGAGGPGPEKRRGENYFPRESETRESETGQPGYAGAFFHAWAEHELRGGRVGGALERDERTGHAVLPVGAGRSRSGFRGGAPFRKENFELEHGYGTLSLTATADGVLGSEFFVNLKDGDDPHSLEKNRDHVVIGRVVEGVEVFELVGELMRHDAWDELRAVSGLGETEDGARACYKRGGERLVDPVWIEECGEMKNYLPPSTKDSTRRRGRGRRGGHGKTRRSRGGGRREQDDVEEDDVPERKYGSVIENESSDGSTSCEEERVTSVVETCAF